MTDIPDSMPEFMPGNSDARIPNRYMIGADAKQIGEAQGELRQFMIEMSRRRNMTVIDIAGVLQTVSFDALFTAASSLYGVRFYHGYGEGEGPGGEETQGGSPEGGEPPGL